MVAKKSSTKLKKAPRKPASVAKANDSRLRLLFNHTAEEKKRVLEYQGGVCAITKRPSKNPNARLAVDHDHKTGLVRGLIGLRVNKGLSLFEDDPQLLRNAADYLDNPPYTKVLGEPVYGILGRVSKKITKVQKKKGITRVQRLYGPSGTETPQPRAALTKENKTN